jgi:hypothetical protein
MISFAHFILFRIFFEVNFILFEVLMNFSGKNDHKKFD